MNSSTIDWESGPRAKGGIDPAPLERLAERAAEERPWLNSLLVIRHGRLLFERCFNGFGPDDLHPVYSVTKQWLSCLVGIALEKGLLPSLDMPLAGYHGSRAPRGSDPRKRMITLRHCLAMQSGLGWRNDMDFATAFSRAADPVAFFFGDDIEVVEVPGTAWVYSACDSQMVAETLRTAIGRPLTEAAREWLADPLGITEFKWPRTISIPGAATWRAEIGAFGDVALAARPGARPGRCGPAIAGRARWRGGHRSRRDSAGPRLIRESDAVRKPGIAAGIQRGNRSWWPGPALPPWPDLFMNKLLRPSIAAKSLGVLPPRAQRAVKHACARSGPRTQCFHYSCQPRYVHSRIGRASAGGARKPPISFASRRAHSMVVWSR